MSVKAIVDLMSFFSGLILILHETLFQSPVHPTMLIMGAAMLGLPAIMQPKEDPKPKPIPRDTDLRIVARLPEEPIEREIRKDLEHLEAYNKLC
jgi:hypothetical protein